MKIPIFSTSSFFITLPLFLLFQLIDQSLTQVVTTEPPADASPSYDGFYDISAKDMSFLCSLMPAYNLTGSQPDIKNPEGGVPTKEKYLHKNHKCWKMRWNPCEKNDLNRAKPCGWYAMMEAEEKDCP